MNYRLLQIRVDLTQYTLIFIFLYDLNYKVIALWGNWRFKAGKTGQGARLSKLLGLLQIKGAFCAADIHNKRLALVIAT